MGILPSTPLGLPWGSCRDLFTGSALGIMAFWSSRATSAGGGEVEQSEDRAWQAHMNIRGRAGMWVRGRSRATAQPRPGYKSPRWSPVCDRGGQGWG